MMKFGFRKLHFYPLMLLLFIFLRRCAEECLITLTYKEKIDFIIPLLIFLSQSIIGGLIHLYYSKVNTGKKIKYNVLSPFKIETVTFIYKKSNLSKVSKKKKIILVIFASMFNFIGTIIRHDNVENYGTKKGNNITLEMKVRSMQIIISTLLCYYSLRSNIYRHQKLSVIIISIFLAFIIIIELYVSEDILGKFLTLLYCLGSCLFRSFLDVIEKYLFDFNYINILKILIYEGLIGLLFYVIYVIYLLLYNPYQSHGKEIIKDMSELDHRFISFIILVIIYIIISGFRNAYRVTTNKYYSPMSRALIESTLDPLLLLYNFFTTDEKNEYKNYWAYFSLILICLIAISFFSLVYNDFVILKFCGLQYNTYSEITNRLYSIQMDKEIDYYLNDEESNSSSINEEEKEKDENEYKIELHNDYIIVMK